MTSNIDCQIIPRLAIIISEIFNVASEDIGPSTTSADVSGWDSLSHTSVIMAVEDAFGISFEMGEIFSMNSVGEMAVLLGQKQAQK